MNTSDPAPLDPASPDAAAPDAAPTPGTTRRTRARRDRSRPRGVRIERFVLALACALGGAGLVLGIVAVKDREPGPDIVAPVPENIGEEVLLHAFGAGEIGAEATVLEVNVTSRATDRVAARMELDAAVGAVRGVLDAAGLDGDALVIDASSVSGPVGPSSTMRLRIEVLEGVEVGDPAGLGTRIGDTLGALGGTLEYAVSQRTGIPTGTKAVELAQDAAIDAAVEKLAERVGVDPEQIQIRDVTVLFVHREETGASVGVQISALVGPVEHTA